MFVSTFGIFVGIFVNYTSFECGVYFINGNQGVFDNLCEGADTVPSA